MKICAIICEYNPFHNGHLHHIRQAKLLTGADAVLCVMSGNFVQRGEAAILPKFTRAKHAVLAGADAVIELPALFATSNAELFAKGAVWIINSIPEVTTLCFGAENAEKDAFITAAQLLNNEPTEVSIAIKQACENGVSYAKARAQAWDGILPESILKQPNNILGVEYTRALLTLNSKIDIFPIQRIGGHYSDTELHGELSSASAIRNALLQNESVHAQIPDFVEEGLPNSSMNCLDELEKYALLIRDKSDIAKICDCTEGLENAFKKAAESPATLVESLTSSRYTSSRIRRIALQNLLNIEEALIRDSLSNALYLRPLAIKKERTDVLSALAKSAFPLIIRQNDYQQLTPIANRCLSVDLFAEKIYKLLSHTQESKNIFY